MLYSPQELGNDAVTAAISSYHLRNLTNLHKHITCFLVYCK